jgi:hypothetical protein
MDQPANFAIACLPDQPALPPPPTNPALPTTVEVESVVAYVTFFKNIRTQFPEHVTEDEIARWDEYARSLAHAHTIGDIFTACLAPIYTQLDKISNNLVGLQTDLDKLAAGQSRNNKLRNQQRD